MKPRPAFTREPNVISTEIDSIEVDGRLRYRVKIEHGIGSVSHFVFDPAGFAKLLDQSAMAITLALTPVRISA